MGSKILYFFYFGAIGMLFSCAEPTDTRQPADYVNPAIGTDYFGHTFPGATLPFAMVQLSPDTYIYGWPYSSGYTYADSSIMGFSHTHLSGTGMTAEGDVLIMPTIGNKVQIFPGSRENPDEGYRSRFDHSDEATAPGYYSVLLKDYGIKAELTTTERVGMHRYTFPKAEKATIIIDLGHEIGEEYPDVGHSMVRVVDHSTIEGYKDNNGVMVYFVAAFSHAFDVYGTFDQEYRAPESGEGLFPWKNEEKGKNVGAFVNYKTEEGESVIIKVGISFVSIEGARKNLEKEVMDWDFDRVREQARRTWNQELKRVTIDGTTEDKKQIFYTAVYHSLLAQCIGQDVDGRFMGMDKQVHEAGGRNFYPSFSCWDTYRTEHPLMTILAPEHVDDMVWSIESKTRNYGWLPAQHFRNEFGQGMVGDHLVPVIVDAFVKGHNDYDAELLYNAMKRKALELPPPPLGAEAGRSGLLYYMELGYAPIDKVTESVPNTMELSYNDWCIAQMAKSLGKEDDYALFMKRAGYYRNVYDSETRFMRPKKADGTWLEAIGDKQQDIVYAGNHQYYKYFDPLLVGRRPNRHYTESNAWQYIWSVQHDVQGLIDLLGSNAQFNQRLDEFFAMSPVISPPKYVGVVGTIGQYVHGNQPSHHVAYLYNYSGMPWKTQEKVRQVTEDFYRTGPGGLCGNEDMGSLSSWYVFSSMGFYPVCPGSTAYTLGSPLFGEVHLKLVGGKEFSIKALNNSTENVYIQSVMLNGEPMDRLWIDHAEIMSGGELVFEMGSNPNQSWAVAETSVPYSMTPNK
jgi:predicted alpha-1,2-mannosidase